MSNGYIMPGYFGTHANVRFITKQFSKLMFSVIFFMQLSHFYNNYETMESGGDQIL